MRLCAFITLSSFFLLRNNQTSKLTFCLFTGPRYLLRKFFWSPNRSLPKHHTWYSSGECTTIKKWQTHNSYNLFQKFLDAAQKPIQHYTRPCCVLLGGLSTLFQNSLYLAFIVELYLPCIWMKRLLKIFQLYFILMREFFFKW